MGIDAYGFDGNRHFWGEFQLRHHDIRQRYVLDPLFTSRVQKSDVFISIEVFEHIPDDALHNIMMRVRYEAQPNFIVFSSTPFASELPGWDVQWGHINLKQPDEWSEFFSRYGYQLHDLKPPVTQWAQLYLKRR
jgi:hypothetical protein